MEQIPLALIEKYSRPGPRYTSYPTAAEFSSDFGADTWVDELRLLNSEVSGSERQISLYLHIPFCHSLCYYCACNKIIPKNREGVPAYLAAVTNEAALYAERLGSEREVDHIHWGGGTPNFLSPEEIVALHQAILVHFPGIHPSSEISVEVDPRTLTREHLRTFREQGFNRISFGVQDFDPEVQECVNRIQPFDLTQRTVIEAREFGFSGINIDLIYGLPNQTREGFCQTIERVIELSPDRIALYGYAHVTWVSKVQTTFRRFDIPSPGERVAIFSEAVSALSDAGYIYLGMDHFAKPGDELTQALKAGTLHRNFMGYTSRLAEPLIGLGVSSISSLSSAIGQNTKDISEYERGVASGVIPVTRGVKRTGDDCIRGNLIEKILCERRVDFSVFQNRWNQDFYSYFPQAFTALRRFESDGLVQLTSEGFFVTSLGAFFLRNIAMTFDSYLLAHEQQGKPVFSQAV